jgi:hypothetical protein
MSYSRHVLLHVYFGSFFFNFISAITFKILVSSEGLSRACLLYVLCVPVFVAGRLQMVVGHARRPMK